MAETTEFELVSPEKLLISQPAEMVVVPGTEGDFGALPRHAPMITGVRPGVIDVYENGKVEKRIFVAGGFAEVTNKRCTVLADEAIRLAAIDRPAVETELAEAKARISALQGAEAAAEKAQLRAAERAQAVAQAKLDAISRGKAADH